MVDPPLGDFCELRRPTRRLFDLVLPPDARDQVDALMATIHHREHGLALRDGTWQVLLLGPPGTGKTALAEAIAHAVGRPLFVLALHALAARREPGALLRRAVHNARNLGAVLLAQEPDRLTAERPECEGVLRRALADFRGLVLIEPRDAAALPAALTEALHGTIALGRPDTEARERLWESALPHDVEIAADGLDLAALAHAYELTGAQIASGLQWAVQRVRARSDDGGSLEQADLEAGARAQVRVDAGQLARRGTSNLSLDQLVLPTKTFAAVLELRDAARHRGTLMSGWGFGRRLVTGKGLVALFTGPPGTGKTLTAEILASELNLKLHIVSIPDVVSKWVGETEKHVRQLFSQARAHHLMLLFDEADALFGTRVNVERAQDHYQNMQVNNLLQEVERFDGTVILTTNLTTNIDKAFQRRILFRIDFPEPRREERERLWRSLIPQEAPKARDLDFERLAASYELTGGEIKNAILRAAYRACARARPLDMAELTAAAEQQCAASGKLVKAMAPT